MIYQQLNQDGVQVLGLGEDSFNSNWKINHLHPINMISNHLLNAQQVNPEEEIINHFVLEQGEKHLVK